ncbi:MAG: cell division protein FtsA [Bacteroidota bacterium]
MDLGTTKVCAAVISPVGEPLGLAVYPCPDWLESHPTREELGRLVAEAVNEADAMSGRHRSRRIWLSLPGREARYGEAAGMARVGAQARRVTRADLERALQAAAAPDRNTLHRLIVASALDGVEMIEEPVGRIGQRLEVRVLLIEAEAQRCAAIHQALADNGLEVQGFTAGVLALDSVLTPAEKEIGTAVLDFGAVHTSIAVFARGAPRFAATIPLGGLHVTRDLAVAFGIPLMKAETEKIAPEGSDAGRSDLREQVIGARVEEILEHARKALERAGWLARLPGHCVLTGGGALYGRLPDLAEKVLGGPARVGLPGLEASGGMVARPGYAVIMGLAAAVRRYGIPSMAPKEVGWWRSKSPQRSMPV